MGRYFLGLLLLGLASAASVPSYIQICHRSDPQVNKCVKRSVMDLLPRLREGIPELNVPKLDPLVLPFLPIDAGQLTVVGKDLWVSGVSNFTITNLKIDVPKRRIFASIKLPRLKITGDYELNSRFNLFPVQTRGNFNIKTTDNRAKAVLQGEVYSDNGIDKLRFKSLGLNIDLDDYEIDFRGDPVMSQFVKEYISQNKEFVKDASKPYIEEAISKVLLDIANNIVNNFAFDEVFPE